MGRQHYRFLIVKIEALVVRSVRVLLLRPLIDNQNFANREARIA
jgi:hypothetical protein